MAVGADGSEVLLAEGKGIYSAKLIDGSAQLEHEERSDGRLALALREITG